MITDAYMPEMDGFTFVEELRKINGAKCDTIMLLGSGGFRGDAARCRELGVAAYLSKPIGRTELHAAILAVVGRQSSAADSSPAALVTRHSLREAGVTRAYKILLAEDDRVNQLLAVRLLRRLGHQVELASDGRETIAALAKQRFDVVLLDIQMPLMDGFEVISRIREEEKQTGAHLPVIAMTAHALTGDRERCLACGMDGYVAKPVRHQELIEAIDQLLGDPLPESLDGKSAGTSWHLRTR